MADSVAQLARIGNGWIVAVGGGEEFFESLDVAIAAIREGADAYWKAREDAENQARGGALVKPGPGTFGGKRR